MWLKPTEMAWSTQLVVFSPFPSVQVPYATLGMLVPAHWTSIIGTHAPLSQAATVVELDEVPRHCGWWCGLNAGTGRPNANRHGATVCGKDIFGGGRVALRNGRHAYERCRAAGRYSQALFSAAYRPLAFIALTRSPDTAALMPRLVGFLLRRFRRNVDYLVSLDLRRHGEKVQGTTRTNICQNLR